MILTQSMNAAAIVVGMVASPAAWAAQEQAVPQMAGAAQAAVTACAQAHPQAERTIELASARLETARQSNSAAAMRTAVDEMQAAFRQLRTEIAPCAAVQAASAAGMPAGHVMPGGQPMPNTAQAPAAVPGTAVMSPRSTAPASAAVSRGTAAPAGADTHTGHVMPGAPQVPATAPHTPASATRSAPAQRPAAAAPPSPGRAVPASPGRAVPPAAADPHAGMVMPAARPAHAAGAEATAGHAMTTVENPAARLADLMCQPHVDPDTAPRATYLGKAYYFCTAADRDLFLKAPAKQLQH